MKVQNPETAFDMLKKSIILANEGINPGIIITGVQDNGPWSCVKSILKSLRNRFGTPYTFADDRDGINGDIHIIKGKCTSRELYKFLYRTRSGKYQAQILMIDDADSIINDTEGSVNLLKAAMEADELDENGYRKGRWVSYKDKGGKILDIDPNDPENSQIELPEEIYYKGTIIIVTKKNVSELDPDICKNAFIQEFNWSEKVCSDILRKIKLEETKIIPYRSSSKEGEEAAKKYLIDKYGSNFDQTISSETINMCSEIFSKYYDEPAISAEMADDTIRLHSSNAYIWAPSIENAIDILGLNSQTEDSDGCELTKNAQSCEDEEQKMKAEYLEKARLLHRNACLAGARIVLHPNSFEISAGEEDATDIENLVGLYVSEKESSQNIIDFHSEYKEDIIEDLRKRCKEILPHWQKYLAAHLLTIKTADALRKENEGKILIKDPVISGFLEPSRGIFDRQWLEGLNACATRRHALQWLPAKQWSFEQGQLRGSVFSWKDAIDAGLPHFILDSGKADLKDKMKMLDNFVATMLLAFPTKKVHITVLENRTVNPFITSLPDSVCKILDIHSSFEDIRNFVRTLREKNRSGRNTIAEPCCPQDIVVLAGYDVNDRVFKDLFVDLDDVIKEGANAGIYFAVVLSDNISCYRDENNRWNTPLFEYFNIYSSLTDSQNNLALDFLRQKAIITSEEDGKDRPAILEDLIVDYIKNMSKVVPNKVYEKISDGTLYNNAPIKDLANQPKSDIDSIVIPIGETAEGTTVNLKLNAVDYISYFILGRSGMGKSFTLHTILTNLMLKYDPSVVDVILMDFKPGGVEMNYYKNVPHVSKLLVNGADKQVAKEILQSIMKEMDRRGEIFQDNDVPSINRYNDYARRNGKPQMKHIVMLVDECQDLFKVESNSNGTNIVTDIARKGRSYGIHMILATQTLQNSDIPGDALAQFSDFLFMGCKEEDVVKCEVNDRDVQKQVNSLQKGEVIYCHRAAQPAHGYVYNYAGKNDIYRNKTHDALLSDHFSKAGNDQFYFNASQIYKVGNDELDRLVQKCMSGFNSVPMGILGKNLSISGEPLYSNYKRGNGSNVLIMGINNRLQAERVLWNNVLSSYYACHKTGLRFQFKVFTTFPEFVDEEARSDNDHRLRLVRQFCRLKNVDAIEEDERNEMLESVAATVHYRMDLKDKDRSAVKGLDEIFLVMPNHQLCYTDLERMTRGLQPLDKVQSLDNVQHSNVTGSASEKSMAMTDSLGFEMPNFGNFEEPEQKPNPGFMAVDLGFGSSQPLTSVQNNTVGYTAGRPTKLCEELRYILSNGPSVGVHTIIQTDSPKSVFSDGDLRLSEMQMFFNDIVMLRLLQAGNMSLPVDSRMVENLSDNVKSLRALVYNKERGANTIIPYNFPDEGNNIFSLITI